MDDSRIQLGILAGHGVPRRIQLVDTIAAVHVEHVLVVQPALLDEVEVLHREVVRAHLREVQHQHARVERAGGGSPTP